MGAVFDHGYMGAGGNVLCYGHKRNRGVEASTLAVGSSVWLNVRGTPTEFLVVQQGKPSSLYDDSCDGTWLLFKDCFYSARWNNTASYNDYANCSSHAYINGDTYFGGLDSEIQNAIRRVKIPYVNGTGKDGAVASGSDGLSTKMFLLSGCEVGFTVSSTTYTLPEDGARLSYFRSGTGTSASKRRIAIQNLSESAAFWWLRSPKLQSVLNAWVVTNDGFWTTMEVANVGYGLRPACILPGDFKFKENAEGLLTAN